MISGKRVLALVPARGGSERLPGKNIRPFFGRPLLAWTLEVAQCCESIDSVAVSSDSPEILGVASECGCDLALQRPLEFASDQASSVDVALHALDTVEQSLAGSSYGVLVLLQPTSPLRLAEDVEACLVGVLQSGSQLGFTVTLAEKSPFKTYWRDEQGCVNPILEIPASMRDQDLPTAVVSNGAVYVIEVDYLRRERRFVSEGAYAHVMPRNRSIDIDDALDFELAEFLMRRRPHIR